MGKYVAMPDAYLSLMEALKHAGIANNARVTLRWVNAEDLLEQQLDTLEDLDGRPRARRFRRARYRREGLSGGLRRTNVVPYLGICLGMQVAVIEFARHEAGLEGANSTEFDAYTPYPVIDLMPEQLELADLGGTMRLGDWPMQVAQGTLLEKLYKPLLNGENIALERHRHRYEVNPVFVTQLQAAGLSVSA